MLLYAVSGAPLSVFWMAFGPVLPVDYPGADQLVAVVPRGELPCGDAALRPVEDDVAALLRDVQHAALQRLPVADAQREARAVAPPERVTGELRRTEIAGEYALFLRGERKSLATDFCEKDGLCTGTVCYTVQDGHAYATTAHKRFYYTNVSQAGNVLLDTAAMPAGTRITAYIIGELGCMTVAGLTL